MTELGEDKNIIDVCDLRTLVEYPVASIIMATYNQVDFLAEAVQGVMKQIVDFPLELIIGDDCSTDGTYTLALDLQQKHPRTIRVITGNFNVGLLSNYARLIRASRGAFIASCDGDDMWIDPGKLQRQVDLLRHNADTGAVHTDFDHILWRRNRWHRLGSFHKQWYDKQPVPQGHVFSDLLRRNFIQISTVCFRGELVRASVDNGALQGSYSVNDWPLCLHVAALSRIEYLPESTTLYRKVSGSITNSGYAARVRMFEGQIRMIEDVCDHFAVSLAERTNALTQLYRPMWSAALFARDDVTFNRALNWLRNNDPSYANSWRARLLPWLAASPIARYVLQKIQNLRVLSREAREYR